MEQITPEVCKVHQQVMDERFSRDKERLDAMDRKHEETEKRQEQIERLSVQMGEMLKNHHEKLDDHDKRIVHLEKKPAAIWDKIVLTAVTGVVSALIGAFMAILIK